MNTTVTDRDFTLVKTSQVHGKGVFAKKTIPKGTRIFEYAGERVLKTNLTSSPHIFNKVQNNVGKVAIVGFENGTPVYKSSKGEFFTIDEKTGDQIYVIM